MKKLRPAFALILALFLSPTIFAGEAAENTAISDAEGPIAIINIYELEQEAAKKTPMAAFDFVRGGADDEVTLRSNTSAFDKKLIVPNGMTGLNAVDTKTTFLGIDLPSPIIMTPTGAHGLVHKEADKASIKGVRKAGTIMSISTYSSVPLKDIADSAPGTPIFFQLYMSKYPGFNEFIIGKAKAAGAKAVIITIDTGVMGNREADKRNNYRYTAAAPNVSEFYDAKKVGQAESAGYRNIGFTGDDIKLIKKISGLPVLVKGIQSPQAAEIAIAAGADGIWVSNHGGRQLDGAPASFDMLPLIAEVVNKRVPIVFDSGIRRGTHVFKALASGADVVAIGRPALYGLILGGSEGVAAVFNHLNRELANAMALAGTKNIEEVKRTQLFVAD